MVKIYTQKLIYKAVLCIFIALPSYLCAGEAKIEAEAKTEASIPYIYSRTERDVLKEGI